MNTIKEALQEGRKMLALSSETASLDAQVLLADVLGRPRTWVLAHAEEPLEWEQVIRFRERLQLCASGQPLPYVLGWWEFYGRRFFVSPAVLIPRPETELLVDRALDFIGRHRRILRVADVGTGSACIGATLALEAADASIVAIDRSSPALAVARRNCRKHGVAGQVDLVQGDLLAAFHQPFDLVCANLPYIPSEELARLAVGKFEPRLALDGGQNGLEQIARLISQLDQQLSTGGLAILEIGAGQGKEVQKVLANWPTMKMVILPDLSDKDRIVEVRKQA